jgi:solute carrier family 8 (sodium/calcium exchanger)
MKVARRHTGPRFSRVNEIIGPFISRVLLISILAAAVLGLYNLVGESEDPYTGAVSSRQLLKTKYCKGDTFLPLREDEQEYDTIVRGVMYFIALVYLFLGVAISADVFMASIETITAKVYTATVIDPESGEPVEAEVEVWNETVANLTLMALGSSAPEILLAVVECISMTFKAGDLGPGTIVGSAAFNLLFIIAICCVSLEETEDNPDLLDVRRIEEFGVFLITAICSLWAYLWLVVTLDWSSKDEVLLWEALFTLVMMPILVFLSWAQDKNWWRDTSKVAPEQKIRRVTISGVPIDGDAAADAIDAMGRDAATADPQAAAKAAAAEAMRNKKKSRLEYRIQATRKMTGGKSIMPKNKKRASVADNLPKLDAGTEGASDVPAPEPLVDKCVIGFAETTCKKMENAGNIAIKVCRSGKLDKEARVHYSTSDGTAKGQTEGLAGRYLPLFGQVLVFKEGETEKEIIVTLLDDNEWQPDEHFFVTLSPADECVQMSLTTHQVIILNDDDPGKFSFSESSKAVLEHHEVATLKIDRCDGVAGQALVYVKLVPLNELAEHPKFGADVQLGDGAVVGTHYKQLHDGSAGPESIWNEEDGELEVVFKDEEDSINLEIELIPNKLSSNVTFVAEITHIEPAGAKMGAHKTCAVIKSDDKNYHKLMEDIQEMMEKEMAKYTVETETWSEQFVAAMTLEADDEDDEDAELEWDSYLLHFLSFYWKVVHAFVPPTSYCGGWATFGVSLAFIGAITCGVGDVAKMFGCILGLKDGITAITFVALGTSLPDTFASKEATIGDDTADAAITNVTGSNSVNVFLGLGIPWTMACLYHSNNKMAYPAGDLVFSVLVFFVCALYCIGLLIYRRKESIGGELGGPKTFAWFTSISLAICWILYVVISALKAEGHL